MVFRHLPFKNKQRGQSTTLRLANISVHSGLLFFFSPSVAMGMPVDVYVRIYVHIHTHIHCHSHVRYCLILILFPKHSLSVSYVIVCIHQGTPEIIGNNIEKIQSITISVSVKWFVIEHEGLKLCNPGHGSGHLRGSDCKGARGVSHSLREWTGLTNTSVEGGVAGLQGRQASSRGQLFLALTPLPPR